MKILIIDDEIHCSDLLSNLLKLRFNNEHSIEVCNNAKEALKLILNNTYDIVFLDIEMPFLNGFDILESIPNIDFHVIFTTAFDKYALKAIKFSALDYLLKPIDEDDLRLALDKAQLLNNKSNNYQFSNLITNIKSKIFNKIGIPSIDGIEFVLISDIVRCQSDSNYTTLFLQSKREIVSSKTLKEYELMLKDHGFARIHNSDLINLSHMKKYVKGDGGNVVMTDGTEITVSRRRKDEFLDML